MLKKTLFFSVFLFSVMFLSNLVLAQKNTINDNVSIAEKSDIINILKDPKYLLGFDVYMAEEGVPNLPLTIKRRIDYNQTINSPAQWQLAQWNNYNNLIEDAIYSRRESFHQYQTIKGNLFSVNPIDGVVKLVLNTSSEYGHNKINPNNPRQDGQKWPHLLISQTMDEKAVPVFSAQEYYMRLKYQIDSVKNNHTSTTYNKSIHSAQFQWFISVNNQNSESKGYGDYFWFGFSFYDYRYDYSPFYANKDINTTGKFIYMPDMKEVLGEQNKTVIGQLKLVQIPIKEYLKKAFELAKESGFLKETNWEDLYIGHTNIGWEVPGSFDVASTLLDMAILRKTEM